MSTAALAWVTATATAITAVATGIVAGVEIRRRREGKRVARRRLVALSQELIRLVQKVIPRGSGTPVRRLRDSRQSWSELEREGVRAGGSIAEQAERAAKKLRQWEDAYTASGSGGDQERWQSAEDAKETLHEARSLLEELLEETAE